MNKILKGLFEKKKEKRKEKKRNDKKNQILKFV